MSVRGPRRQTPKFSDRLTIMLSRDLRRALERQADESERSMGDVARKLLADQLLTVREKTDVDAAGH